MNRFDLCWGNFCGILSILMRDILRKDLREDDILWRD